MAAGDTIKFTVPDSRCVLVLLSSNRGGSAVNYSFWSSKDNYRSLIDNGSLTTNWQNKPSNFTTTTDGTSLPDTTWVGSRGLANVRNEIVAGNTVLCQLDAQSGFNYLALPRNYDRAGSGQQGFFTPPSRSTAVWLALVDYLESVNEHERWRFFLHKSSIIPSTPLGPAKSDSVGRGLKPYTQLRVNHY